MCYWLCANVCALTSALNASNDHSRIMNEKNIVIIVWLVALKIVSFGVLLFCVFTKKKSKYEKKHIKTNGGTYIFIYIYIHIISYTYFALASARNVQMVGCFWIFLTNRNGCNENGSKSNRKNLNQNGLTLIYFEHAIL